MKIVWTIVSIVSGITLALGVVLAVRSFVTGGKVAEIGGKLSSMVMRREDAA